MGHSKLSVTIPDEVYDQINEFALKKKIKLSHLVTEALVEKLRMKREQDYIQQVNEVIKNTEVAEEQHRMAEIIADNTNVDELPW
jgi:metal-responsive CopG/Arc/MetJ family transcriptional regulator